MNPYLEGFLVVALYVIYVLSTLIKWILYPFRPVWYILYILILPFLHVGEAVWAMFSYPARLFPGSLVETLWIYLSTAAVIGLLTGAALVITHQILFSVLKLNRPSSATTTPRPAKRTMADYRASRDQKRDALKTTRLTDIDDLGYVSPKALRDAWMSPDHISPISSPTMTDSQMKWARRSLVTSPGAILEEDSSEDYF